MALNTVAELSGLTNEQKIAYMEGANIDAASLDDFNVTSYPAATITVTPMLAPKPYTVKGQEYAAVVRNRIEKGYAPTYTEFDYENGLEVSGKAQDLMIAGMLNQLYQGMGMLSVHAIASAAVDTVFNDGFTVNGPDGVPLVSASHPSNVGNQSNYVASALDHASAQSAERMIMDTLGHDGQKLAYRATSLLVPVALMHTGAAVNAPATLLPTAGSSAYTTPNPQAGRFRVFTQRHFTSSTKWFMTDSNLWLPHVNVSRPPSPVVKDDPDSPRGKRLLDELTLQVAYYNWRGLVGGGT